MEIRLTIGRETLEPGFTMRLFDGDKPDGLQLEFSKGAIHVKNLTVCHPGSVHTAPVPDGNDPLSIAIFLDVSIAEIFIDNRIAISHRVYPRNGSNRITVFAPQPFSVERAVFYPLRNAPISFWD